MKRILSIAIILSSFSVASQCFMSRFTGGMLIETTTGNNELDELLHQQKSILEEFFGLNVNLYFGTELNRKGNAFFTPHCNSFNCNGEIALGKHLMLELNEKSHSYERLVGVFAHEFAHGLQYKYGWAFNNKLRELHADFLAGFFLGRTREISESELTSIYVQFRSLGDDGTGPDPHGSDEERGCALLAGFHYAQESSSVNSAYNAGKQYVIDNNPCYKYKQTGSRSGYYFPSSGNSDYAGMYVVAVVIGATVLLSNDIYYRRVYSFHNPNTLDSTEHKNGSGGHFGFRKQFNRSALEYGVSNVRFKPKNNLTGTFVRQMFFNLNYVHDLNFHQLPKRLRPYIGAGVNLGDGAGLCAIAGMYIPLLDRFKLDFRYEIGNRVNQFQFGLIFKYQKEYLWNK